jgi:hypothetical protein
MNNDELIGWKRLIVGYPWFVCDGCFQLPAYSEYMPPPRLGCTPFGEIDFSLFSNDDLHGWSVSEIEEEIEIRPGIEHIGHQIMKRLINLGKGRTEYHIGEHGGQNLLNNPYWPSELAEAVGKLNHERFVVFLPLMLSRTQDDKGRVNWTFFGGSIHSPEYAFWKSFYNNPGEEISENESISFIARVLNNAYGEKIGNTFSLYNIGFRILPSEKETLLPNWTKPFLIDDEFSFEDVKYLLTFRPFSYLPSIVKKRYLSGMLFLLPFPGSLVFWGMPTYLRLKKDLPLALQIPLLRLVARNRGLGGLRVPQSGWLHEPHPDQNSIVMHKELLHDTFHRTHRWERIHRHQDELSLEPRIAKLTKVLFSTELNSLGLYDKPLARNTHLWTKDFDLLLNGPAVSHSEIRKAEMKILNGGLFGYRFYYPPMQVGVHEVFWHRPMVAYLSASNGEVEILSDALLGVLTAYHKDDMDKLHPVELWPRLQKRQAYLSAIHDFNTYHDHYAHQTALNILTLFDTWEIRGKKSLPGSFAHLLLNLSKHKTFEQWLDELTEHSINIEIGKKMQIELGKILEPEQKTQDLSSAITYNETNKRSFEENWWNDIKFLAHGQFINKDNADCVHDDVTMNFLQHGHRDLEQLGDYLITRHLHAIAEVGMGKKAICGELPFTWKTDFDFSAFGGWKRNQQGHACERNIMVIIPGKNRKKAVVMADHYDTAYMEDIYEKERGGSGARISANGADDNYSATATLLQAAPIFLKLAKENKLECDVWLLHLTGEEFPSDCLGARNFCQTLIENTIKLFIDKDNYLDLSSTEITGVFVMDMIGHNRDNDKNIFQISPGKSVKSLNLAYQAHIANMIWNAGVHVWNKDVGRLHCIKGKRNIDGITIPEVALHLLLEGEIRTHYNPHSSIFNTDGQIFSDVGIPVVLFMENYDINRSGYHDTKDTMENIDLDYGAALAAIAIETVARCATLSDLSF